MNTTDFSLIFPEVDNPNKLLNTLEGIAHSRNLPDHEFYSVLHDLSLKRINYTGYTQNPDGYIITSFENACTDYFKEEGKTTSLNENQIVETNIEPDFDAKNFIEKLAELDVKVAQYNLSSQENLVLQLLKDIAKNDHSSMSKYFKEVREKAALEDLSYSNLRKILERLRVKLRSATDLRDGLMSFIPNDDNTEIANCLDMIISNIKVPLLDAYRFSQEEMKKMSDMQNLFLKNHLLTGRFPEVYYTEFDNALELYPGIDRPKRSEKIPDYLGIYISQKKENDIEEEEGIIILFKDRIEAFCLASEKNINNVRMIVLMHELGHWLTHMSTAAKESKENKTTIEKPIPGWAYGYFEPHLTHIIEGLANIITYWSCESANEFAVLDSLTPKKTDGSIDTENPYGVYCLLLHKEKDELINKIAQISRVFYVEEKVLLEFLISDILHFADFVKSKSTTILFSPETIQKIDDSIKKAPLTATKIFKGNDSRLDLIHLFPLSEMAAKYIELLGAGGLLNRFL